MFKMGVFKFQYSITTYSLSLPLFSPFPPTIPLQCLKLNHVGRVLKTRDSGEIPRISDGCPKYLWSVSSFGGRTLVWIMGWVVQEMIRGLEGMDLVHSQIDTGYGKYVFFTTVIFNLTVHSSESTPIVFVIFDIPTHFLAHTPGHPCSDLPYILSLGSGELGIWFLTPVHL